jgi:hypothetical protein
MFGLFPEPINLPDLPDPNQVYRVEYQPRTLRDEFAMAILPAVLTTYEGHCKAECVKGGNGSIHEIAARIAYAYADAMMAERDK